jgi:hypothetical protein
MDAFKSCIELLRTKQDNITVIDVGCARCSFINMFLINYFDKSKIKCIGIDPLRHKGIFDATKTYDFYVEGCVDNINKKTVEQKKFYVNSIDQASSLLKIKSENFSSDLTKRDFKFYYPQNIIDRLSIIKKEIIVNVYNLSDIIEKTLKSNEIIDFIKIDAEGKDLDIVKSIQNDFHRIKYIGLECSSHNNIDLEIFENGAKLQDVIEFFKKNNFEIFNIIDYSIKENNLTQMSDVVFKNTKI